MTITGTGDNPKICRDRKQGQTKFHDFPDTFLYNCNFEQFFQNSCDHPKVVFVWVGRACLTWKQAGKVSGSHAGKLQGFDAGNCLSLCHASYWNHLGLSFQSVRSDGSRPTWLLAYEAWSGGVNVTTLGGRCGNLSQPWLPVESWKG